MPLIDVLINSNDFNAGSSITDESIEKITSVIHDKNYLEFIKKINGGFFYNYSLHIYAVSTSFEFHDIFKINEIIKESFGKIIKNDFYFAQEIFGNQFGYCDEGIVFLNIESGERNIIARDFDEWMEILNKDLDYFTGRKLVESWNKFNNAMKPNERFCPKIPFVIGGKFEIENLFLQAFPKNILANANIATQIYELPDGTPIKLKIIE
mgnify:CR=1 FL=1